jgi:hypothetical protein
MIRTQMSSTVDQKWSHCMGRFVRYHPITLTSDQYITRNDFDFEINFLTINQEEVVLI